MNLTPLTPAQQQTVEDHLPMVKVIARNLKDKLSSTVQVEDLVQDGVLGLVDAVRRYDPEKNDRFSGFAKSRILGAMIDGIRSLDWISRDSRRWIRKRELAIGRLISRFSRNPSEEEIAEEMHLPLQRYHSLLGSMRAALASNLHFSAARHDDNDETLESRLRGNADDRPDRMFEKSEAAERLNAAIRTLPPRRKKLIELHYFGQMPMRQIGTEHLGVNESRISQMNKDSLAKLRKHYEARGMTTLKAAA